MESTIPDASVAASGHLPGTVAVKTDRCRISRSAAFRALGCVSLCATWTFSLSGCALVGGGPQTVVQAQEEADRWQIGTPIVGYYHGPGGGGGRWGPLTDGMAERLVDAGFSLVWGSSIEDLDVAHAHGLRVTLHSEAVNWRSVGEPGALDDPVKSARIDSLIERVKDHPALYDYVVADERSATVFPTLARVVAYIRENDPAHPCHINLFPTYASAKALGTAGDTETAYREHLRQYIEIVKPDLISWDHYPFRKTHDSGDYFLNLALIREASLNSGVPFINVVQAVALSETSRVPKPGEGRFQAYTTLAYGGQGISHFTYWPYSEFRGGISGFDDDEFDEKRAAKDAAAPFTPLGEALREIHPRFVAIAEELQSLKSLGVYHLGVIPQGGVGLPATAAFAVDPAVPAQQKRGILLGYFGLEGKTSHVLVVNLDYTQELTTTVVGPGAMDAFDPSAGEWRSASNGPRAKVDLMKGGGVLLRLRQE